MWRTEQAFPWGGHWSKFLAPALHFVASGLLSTHFTFLACLMTCSVFQAKGNDHGSCAACPQTSIHGHLVRIRVQPNVKCRESAGFWVCFDKLFTEILSISLKGEGLLKRGTYFLVVQKTSLQIHWVRWGWWLHACSRCWRTVKEVFLELADTSWKPINAWKFHMDSALTPDPTDSLARPICQAVHPINIRHAE